MTFSEIATIFVYFDGGSKASSYYILRDVSVSRAVEWNRNPHFRLRLHYLKLMESGSTALLPTARVELIDKLENDPRNISQKHDSF